MSGSSEQASAVPLLDSVHEHRRRSIQVLIPRWYSPAVHLAIPTVLGLTVMIVALGRLQSFQLTELLAVPSTLFFGFGFEWCVHKFVLHRRLPLLGTIYERHELQHHIVFTHEDMAMRNRRELWLILMPAYAIVLVALFNAPIAYLASQLITPNTGLIFLVTSMCFFLSYEWLHLAYHLPPSSFIGRLGLISRLREHHRRHHDPRRMKRWNFNVTVPLFDWICRTIWSPEREAEKQVSRTRKVRPSTTAIEHS